MIRRLLSLAVLAWLLGFAAFVLLLPRPAGKIATDAIVVPTGGSGRIARGIALIEAGHAKRMLITGVDRRVTRAALAEKQGVSLATTACCVDLGREASDTRSNAEETATWVRGHKYTSIRLVTTDWHMPRTRFELSRTLGPGVRVVPDAVRSEADLSVLLREYNKYVFRRASAVLGI